MEVVHETACMEVVQSFGMPLVNCPLSHAYNSVGSTTDL